MLKCPTAEQETGQRNLFCAIFTAFTKIQPSQVSVSRTSLARTALSHYESVSHPQPWHSHICPALQRVLLRTPDAGRRSTGALPHHGTGHGEPQRRPASGHHIRQLPANRSRQAAASRPALEERIVVS